MTAHIKIQPGNNSILDAAALAGLAPDYGCANGSCGPVKSLVKHAMALEMPAAMDLFWAADKKEGLYMNTPCRSWDDALENFNYYPLVNVDAARHLPAKYDNLETVDVYTTGPETRIRHACEKLLADGLPDEQLMVTSIDQEQTGHAENFP